MKKWALLLLCLPTIAMAHPGHGTDGWLAGFTHPLTGWDHLLAMVSVGLWAATFQAKARWLIPTTFVSVMVLGFVLGTQNISVPLLEQGIAASVLVLGLAAAWSKRIPASVAMILVAAFALYHGIAHGMEMHNQHALGFAIGFIIATVTLHLIGFILGNSLSKQQWLLRLSGSVIALTGLGMLLTV